MNRGDRWIIGLALILTFFGVLMVYSAGSFASFIHHQGGGYYLQQQAVRVVLGGALMWFCARKLNLRWLETISPWTLGACCLLLVAVIAVGHTSKGATRWFRVGSASLQPTELARVAAVVFMAAWLKRRPISQHGFWRGLVPPMLLLGFVSALIFKQPALSSAALLFATGFTMFFLSGAPLRYLAIPVGVGALAVVGGVATHPYQLKRVSTFLDFVLHGKLDAQGAGYQIDQSLIAIGSGGIFGRGLGAGFQKLLSLPDAHTDFIFAIVGEELGLVGATVLLVVFALFLWRGLRVTARCSDPFACLLAGGITVQFGLYAVANLMVATSLAPTTGLPLPFVSYGGSALLVNLAAAGILYRISALNGEDEALTRSRWAREAA